MWLHFCWAFGQNYWPHHCWEVQADSYSSCSTIREASDCSQIHSAAWQWPQTHGQSRKELYSVKRIAKSPTTDGMAPTEPWSQHYQASPGLHAEKEARQPESAGELWQVLEKAWNNLKLFDRSAPKRIHIVLKAMGDHAKYWLTLRFLLFPHGLLHFQGSLFLNKKLPVPTLCGIIFHNVSIVLYDIIILMNQIRVLGSWGLLALTWLSIQSQVHINVLALKHSHFGNNCTFTGMNLRLEFLSFM